MAQFLLQMAGWMGSGKSTIALAVGSSTGSVVLSYLATRGASGAAAL